MDLKNTPAPVEKEVHILLSDIRGFTSLSENISGMQVAELLNVYFSIMIPIIARYGETVDKLMGDSILAVFDAGDNPFESALAALAAAAEMQMAMDKVNDYAGKQGIDTLYMGIAINTGKVVSIVLGTREYRELTIIGNEVNMVSRIESFTLRGQVLMSDKTFALVKDKVTIGSVNHIRVKGKNLELVLHELQAILEPKRLDIPEREVRRSPRVPVMVPVKLQVIKNKIVRDYVHDAMVVDASYGGFSINSPHALEMYLDVLLTIQFPLVSPVTHEIYAKVLRTVDTGNGYAHGVEITSIKEEAKKQLKSLVDINV